MMPEAPSKGCERNLPPIAKSLQSFEVRGDHINFAGVYTIQMSTDPDGNMVEFQQHDRQSVLYPLLPEYR